MKVLIFGGTGAMGTSLVGMLAEQGHEVCVTTRRARRSDLQNVKYIRGNAHEMDFVRRLLTGKYDVIVDFMVYGSNEFAERASELLQNTGQYVFLSSSRVYADSVEPIRESSPRLLDVCDDAVYLNTDEYALAKAREEDILRNSGCLNWTVIRPYITYSNKRLQLGFWEKEAWLQRVLRGGTIVRFKDIESRYTTLTDGNDVAKGIACLLGNEKALGESFHIVSSKSMLWHDVWELYKRVIFEETGTMPKEYAIDSGADAAHYIGADYQYRYDRMFNRKFDSGKLATSIGTGMDYVPMDKGLEKALREFLREGREFLGCDWWLEGYLDRITGEHAAIGSIHGRKDKAKYILSRYTFLGRHRNLLRSVFRYCKRLVNGK